MYIYELLDILFFIKSYKSPINSFNIFQYVTFNNSFTRSRDKKLIHIASNNLVNSNSYFCRISRLWNALPIIDITSSLTAIKSKLLSFLWNHFLLNFSSNSNCSLHFYARVINVPCHQLYQILIYCKWLFFSTVSYMSIFCIII